MEEGKRGERRRTNLNPNRSPPSDELKSGTSGEGGGGGQQHGFGKRGGRTYLTFRQNRSSKVEKGKSSSRGAQSRTVLGVPLFHGEEKKKRRGPVFDRGKKTATGCPRPRGGSPPRTAGNRMLVLW